MRGAGRFVGAVWWMPIGWFALDGIASDFGRAAALWVCGTVIALALLSMVLVRFRTVKP